MVRDNNIYNDSRNMYRRVNDYFLYETLFVLPFEQQSGFKYKQSRNYRKTVFIYINFLQKFNWVFWRKHSALSEGYHLDTIAYSNSSNIIFLTERFTSLKSILLNQFFNLRYNRYIMYISTEESRNFSISDL